MSIISPRKKTRMLSTYSGQNSFISNIDDVEIWSTAPQKGKGNSSAPKLLKRESLLYEVFFDIDMRKLIESNVQFLEFSILKASPARSARMFNMIPSRNQSGLAAALYVGTAEGKKVLADDRKKKTLGAGKINLRPYLNDIDYRKYNNIKKTDIELFGKIESVSLVRPEAQKTIGLGALRVSNTPVQVDDGKDDASPSSHVTVYRKTIEKKKDPGLSYKPIKNVKNVGARMKSEKQEKVSDFFDKNIMSEVSALRGKFENLPSRPITSMKKLSDTRSRRVGVVQERVNRVRTISHSFRIFSETLEGYENFIFSVSAKDPNTGLVTEILEFKINHRINVENYYIPESLPKVSILRDKPQKGISNINGMVSDINWKIKNVSMCTRNITDDSNLAYSPFTFPVRIEKIKEVRNQNCYKLENIGRVSMHQMSIVRMIPETITGLKICNFSSDSVSGESFHYVYSGLYSKILKNGINIEYFVDSDEIAGVSVYRKLPGENQFSPVRQYPIFSQSQVGSATTLSNPPISQGAKKNGSISVNDTIPNPNDLVQYKLRLFLKNGGDQFTRQSSTILYVEPLRIVKVNMSSPDISMSSQIPFPTAKFNIDYELAQTNTDKVLSILRDLGNESIFDDQVELTKDALSDICILGVKRVNVTSSEVDWLGFHKPGEFLDDGTHGERLRVNHKYIYFVNAYLTNSDQVKKSYEVAAGKSKRIIADIKQVRIPSFISKVQTAALKTTPIVSVSPSPTLRVVSLGASTLPTIGTPTVQLNQAVKLMKNFSPLSLGSGIIKSFVDMAQDYDPGNFNTGDYALKRINLEDYSVKINGMGSTTLTRSNMGAPVLRFIISPSGSVKLNFVDYVVITCIRNGQETICGACHAHPSGFLVFIDYTSQDYVGDIEYFATPVFINGVKGQKASIASSTLVPLRPMKRTK